MVDKFQCQYCNKTYLYKRGLNRHIKYAHDAKTLDKVYNTYNDKVSINSDNVDDDVINRNDINQENIIDEAANCVVEDKIEDAVDDKESIVESKKSSTSVEENCSEMDTGNYEKENCNLNNEFRLIKSYSCELYDKNYSHKNALKFHYLDIHCHERFYCSVCDKYFITKENLSDHFQLNHVFYKFLCDKCGKIYCNKHCFKEHYNVKHLKIKLKCNLCNNLYLYKRNLNEHFNSVHRRKKYTCYCGNIYSTTINLRRHQRIKNHHEPNRNSDIVL